MLEITDIYENIINSININDTPIIGIDGLGGAGKSTISEKLCRIFEENDYHTVLLYIDEFIEQMKVEAKNYAESPFTEARKHYGIHANQEYSCEKERLFEGVSSVLEKLSKRYHLGVLANQPASTLERLKRDGIYTYFDVCLLSDCVNMQKLDISFFEYALEKIQCDPQKVIMVGDRLDNDIMPAKKAGMKTVRIRQGLNAVQEPFDNTYIPDYEVYSVQELLGVFE